MTARIDFGRGRYLRHVLGDQFEWVTQGGTHIEWVTAVEVIYLPDLVTQWQAMNIRSYRT